MKTASKRINTPAKAIVEALGGKWNGHSGMALCPAHDDHDPSLKVTDLNGWVLVHCKARCVQNDVIAALRRKGLWPGASAQIQTRKPDKDDDRDDSDNDKFRRAYAILRAAVKAGERKSIRTYLESRAIDIDRVPLSLLLLPAEEAERLNLANRPTLVTPIIGPNGFQGVHCTALSNDLRGKAKPKKPRNIGPLKGGYAIVSKLERDEPLIIAEGVETALAASKLAGGVSAIATLSATNMPQIEPPQCSEVIIAADNDKPGRDAAEKLARRLTAHGRTVRIATPKIEGDDWNDVLLSGDNKTSARCALLEAPLYEAPPGLSAISAYDLLEMDIPDRPMMVSPWLPQQSIALIYAKAGAGKTRLALAIAYAVTQGRDLLGWQVKQSGRVLYVDGELSMKELQSRVRALGPIPDNLLLLSNDDVYQNESTWPDIGTEEGREALDAVIEAEDIVLIILDSLSTLDRTGMENEAQSWTAIQEWAMRHRAQGRSIIFIHHAGKNGQQRGTSKREVVPHTIIALLDRSDLADEDGMAIEVQFQKHRGQTPAEARPFLARFAIRDGVVEWTRETLNPTNADRVIAMVADGMKQSEIARELKITPSAVSQILTKERKRRNLA